MCRYAWLFVMLLWPLMQPQATTPVPIVVQSLGEVGMPGNSTAPASVIAANDTRIAAELTAPVARIHVEVGDTVKARQLLLELDAADFRLLLAQAEAQVSAAQARVALAEQRLRRGQSLKQRQFAAADEVLELETEVQAARADLEVARAQRAVAARNVEKCRIVAPFAGAVLERQAQVGAMAMPGVILLRLVDLAPPEIEAQVQAIQADDLLQAQDVMFESQGRRYSVRLLRLSPIVEGVARTRVARLSFTAAGPPAGTSGMLRWLTPGLLLPPELLVRRNQGLGAFVVEDGRARFVSVPAAQEGRPFALALPPETPIVVGGQQALHDGQPVTISDGSS